MKITAVELDTKDYKFIISYEDENGRSFRIKTNDIGSATLGSAITSCNKAVIRHQRTTDWWFSKVNKIKFAAEEGKPYTIVYTLTNKVEFPIIKTKASFSFRISKFEKHPDEERIMLQDSLEKLRIELEAYLEQIF